MTIEDRVRRAVQFEADSVPYRLGSLPSVVRARVRSADMPHDRYMLCTRTDGRFQIVTSVQYDRSNRLT